MTTTLRKRLRCRLGLHGLDLLNIEIDGTRGSYTTWETWEFYHGDCPHCGATVYRKVCTV